MGRPISAPGGIRGNEMCIDFGNDGDSNCFEVWLRGNKVVMQRDAEDAYPARRNPRRADRRHAGRSGREIMRATPSTRPRPHHRVRQHRCQIDRSKNRELGRNSKEELDMKKQLALVTLLAMAAMPALAQAAGIDWQKVDAALGKPAVVSGDVHRYGLPRSDLKVTLDGVAIKPALGTGRLGCIRPDWAAKPR